MRFRRWMNGFSVLGLSLCIGALLVAQTVTGTIVGTVVDSSGAVVPGASVQLTDVANGAARTAATGRDGVFHFPNLDAGTYIAVVNANGFKTSTTVNIQLNASSTRDLGKIAMQVGSTSQEVTVTAAATPIQTSSSEVSHAIEGAALDALPLKGRDVFGAMKLDAGVVDTDTSRESAGSSALSGIIINGNTSPINFTVDGVTDMNTQESGVRFEPNMDSIQEVKILSSNYQAEYGRNSGGSITVITKSGATKFHGSAWAYHRHEEFNANSYFNNENGLPRPLYRYNIDGWSFGGPVPLGWLKNKLFFFASQEYTNQLGNNSVQTNTFATALEKTGDFSQSYDKNGKLIKLIDPLTGNQFPGNRIPAAGTSGCGTTTSCINPVGQAMLKFFPDPNFSPVPGSTYGAKAGCALCSAQANYQAQAASNHAHRNDVVRIDFDPISKLTSYFRWSNDVDDTNEVFQGVPFNIKQIDHPNPGWGWAESATYVISPTLINTATFGHTWQTWSWYLQPGSEAQIDRSVVDNPPLLLPLPTSPAGVNGYSNVMPQISFGGNRPHMASYSNGTFDYHNDNPYYTFTDDVSKVAGAHQFKAGVFWDQNGQLQPSTPAYNGSYNFGVDANNPLNAGDGFANALLGNYDSFSQVSARAVFDSHYTDLEFYAQDSWRITQKLNLDLGIRFYHQSPVYDSNHTFSEFVPSLYTKPTQALLYAPGCSATMAAGQNCKQAGGKVIAVNPNDPSSTGPAAYIGAFLPGANIANGIVVPGENGVSQNPYTVSPLRAAPRIGFAYDVFGNGKTAIRGGFGVFYDRLDGNRVNFMSGQVPLAYNYQVSQGNMADLATTTGVIAPSNVYYFSGKMPWPVVKNASLNWQQALGFQTSLSVGWVGNYSQRQPFNENVNAVPLGADFKSSNISPATGGPLTQVGSAAERVNYPGFLNLSQLVFYGSSNYNALEVVVQHRQYRNVLFGVAYTWSKSLGVTSYDPLVANNHARNYGPLSSNRGQTLEINYSWRLPGVGNKLAGAALNNWTFSGLTSYTAGAPFSPTFTANGLDFTGSANETARMNLVGNPLQNVPAGQILNPAAFAVPTAGSGDIGNLGTNAFTLPGFSDWDMSFTKLIPVGFSEGAGFSLQVQAFNVFNHPQFTGYGGNWSNGNFAQPTGAAPARVVALNLRYQF